MEWRDSRDLRGEITIYAVCCPSVLQIGDVLDNASDWLRWLGVTTLVASRIGDEQPTQQRQPGQRSGHTFG